MLQYHEKSVNKHNICFIYLNCIFKIYRLGTRNILISVKLLKHCAYHLFRVDAKAKVEEKEINQKNTNESRTTL